MSASDEENHQQEVEEPIGEVDLATNLVALPRNPNSSTNSNSNLVARRKQRQDQQQEQEMNQSVNSEHDNSSSTGLGEKKNSVRFNETANKANDDNQKQEAPAARAVDDTEASSKSKVPKSVLKKTVKVAKEQQEASFVVETATETLQLTKKASSLQTKKDSMTSSSTPSEGSNSRDETKNQQKNKNEDGAAAKSEADEEAHDQDITFEFGDLFAFEFISASHNTNNLATTESNNTKGQKTSSPWAWGVGREVTAATRDIVVVNDSTTGVLSSTQKQHVKHQHKRIITLELWEVEGREDKLTKPERARLAELRRQIANTSADLAQLETQRRGLDDALEGALLSIAAIDSALAADFADVQDLLIKARRALSNLKTEHFAEMRNYAKPPVTVRQVLECVLIAIGEVQQNAVTWDQVKVAVRREDFVLNIRDFEPSQLNPAAIKLLQTRIQDPSFTHERAVAASFAAGPLHQWISAQIECANEARRSKAYHDLSKQIAQHRHRCRLIEEESRKLAPRILKLSNSISSVQCECDKILFGNENISFAKNIALLSVGGKRVMSHTGFLLSSPFPGLKFVPQEDAPHIDMLRVTCHRLGQPDRLEPSPFVALNADKANVVRNAFDLPKLKLAAGVAHSGDTPLKVNNSNPNVKIHSHSNGPAARTASNTNTQKADYVLVHNNNNNNGNVPVKPASISSPQQQQQQQQPNSNTARVGSNNNNNNNPQLLQPLSYTARVAPPQHNNNSNNSTANMNNPSKPPTETLSFAELKQQRKAPSSSPPRNLPSLTDHSNSNNTISTTATASKPSVTPPAKIMNNNSNPNSTVNGATSKNNSASSAPLEATSTTSEHRTTSTPRSKKLQSLNSKRVSESGDSNENTLNGTTTSHNNTIGSVMSHLLVGHNNNSNNNNKHHPSANDAVASPSKKPHATATTTTAVAHSEVETPGKKKSTSVPKHLPPVLSPRIAKLAGAGVSGNDVM